MARYLYLGRYNGDGCRGVVAEGGSGRESETRELFSALGGRVETYQFAVGPDFDFVIIAEMPDTAAAIVPPLMASATGTVEVRTTLLLSPAEEEEAGAVDVAAQQARGLSFRAAGS